MMAESMKEIEVGVQTGGGGMRHAPHLRSRFDDLEREKSWCEMRKTDTPSKSRSEG